MLENDKIIIKDDSGVEKEFYKLVSFHSTKTNKDYLIYCDDDKKLYSSVVEKTSWVVYNLEKLIVRT